MDEATLKKVKADPNFPSIYHDPWFCEVTDIRRGPYGTTRARVDGEPTYFYKGHQLRRDERVTAGYHGAWKSDRAPCSDTLGGLVAELDSWLERRRARMAEEPATLGAAIGDDIKWHGVPGGR